MKVSGFTIVRNAVKFNYPALESIKSILPICDEFIVNVGEGEDETLSMIRSLRDPKIKIIQRKWDFSQGKSVLSAETNLALKECKGDWAFYLQADEVIHEKDLGPLRKYMQKYQHSEKVDALRFAWMHFYGSYYRYRIDSGWFQKQDRIIKNNRQMESYDDAYGFRRKDLAPMRRINTGKLLYHYGWVHPQEVMSQRRKNAEQIGFASLTDQERQASYSYGDLNRFPVYFGSHPCVMNKRVSSHELSRKDLDSIRGKYWWHPFRILKVRAKTFRRVKEKII
ncbi:MAG: glycosyltransferase [Candidatus Omnitrophota bacterium]